MIRLQAATFADAANVRENLVSILGGGVSFIRRPSYPAALGAVLVVVIEFSEELPSTIHQFSITLKSRDSGDVIINYDAEIGTLGGADLDERGLVPVSTLPVVLPMLNVEIPNAGRYEAEVLGDGSVIGGARIDAVVLTDDSAFNPEWV